jgi:hypothetical protein
MEVCGKAENPLSHKPPTIPCKKSDHPLQNLPFSAKYPANKKILPPDDFFYITTGHFDSGHGNMENRFSTLLQPPDPFS